MEKILLVLVMSMFILTFAPSSLSLAHDWAFWAKPRGTIKVVDPYLNAITAGLNCGVPLVALDKGSSWVPCLAQNWRWTGGKTIEFKLKVCVRFKNNENVHASIPKT